MIASQRSAGKLSIAQVCWMPALLIDDVDRPQRLRGRSHQAGGLVGAGQVGAHVGAARGQLRSNRRALVGVFDAVHHHLRAGLRQRLGNGQADALGGTGDECGTAFEHESLLGVQAADSAVSCVLLPGRSASVAGSISSINAATPT